MKREELERGKLIRERKAEDQTMDVAFHYVLLNGEIVGVGLYHAENKDCTIAMVRDFKGNPLGQEESAGYPTTQGELDDLDDFFHDFLAQD
ncbi:hypothetical protein [Sphingobacterium griseoflavum]|uniref:Uncharacterized protein n=1 Tax=Sphingobacterium griseoflavum TaxID=1474952 RepID=A0ABQ3HQ74_9SPHI|nr:hypothetical protein [Sphingobacterium griseoflavum]GHE23426.1 hypothetical protein GCM10017764_03940 [Sphingobacterium griseoflavum]